MKINRVFCYSKDVAKKNKNKAPVLGLVLTIVFWVCAMVALVTYYVISGNPMEYFAELFIGMFLLFMGFLVYFSVKCGKKQLAKVNAFAISDNNRIFKVMKINNGQGLYYGGVAAGGLVDQFTGSDSNFGSNIGGLIGVTAYYRAINRSAEYMSHPEVVAKIVESVPNITGAEVFEILNVHNVVDKKHSIKVNCDYIVLRTNKILYRKNIIIDKSYNMFDDLIEIINTHR